MTLKAREELIDMSQEELLDELCNICHTCRATSSVFGRYVEAR